MFDTMSFEDFLFEVIDVSITGTLMFTLHKTASLSPAG